MAVVLSMPSCAILVDCYRAVKALYLYFCNSKKASTKLNQPVELHCDHRWITEGLLTCRLVILWVTILADSF
jgi:hypothetical protein